MKASLELIALILTLVSTLTGAIVWYNTAQRKRFASEMEWEKTMKFQQAINDKLEMISAEIKRHDMLAEKLIQKASTEFQRELIEIDGTLDKLGTVIQHLGDRIDDKKR